MFDFTTQSTNFKTYVEFGYLFGLASQGQTPLTIAFESKDNVHSYEDTIDYYNLIFDSKIIIGKLKLAPFLRLTSASMTYRYIDQTIVTNDPSLTPSDIGKIQYMITYQILLEGGAQQTIVQTIEERDPKDMLVYSDDNLLTSNSFDITREAFETRVDIDFNLITPSLYQQIMVKQDNVNIDGIYSPEAEVYFGDHDLMFNLILTAQLDVGNKTYEFIVNREEVSYSLGVLDINKLLGVSAYLLDIRYPKDDEPLLIYPIIRASNQQGVPNDTHDTRVYFNGIDYDSAITERPKS